MAIRAGNSLVHDDTEILPAWVWKLILRLSRLEPGNAYTVTVIMAHDGEPIWTVQPAGKVENGRT